MNGFSLNQATTKRWPLDDLVAGCVAAGVPAVGLWREVRGQVWSAEQDSRSP